MFFRSFVSVLSLAILAVAMPNVEGLPKTITITAHGSQPTHVKGGTCSTGPIECCQQLKKASDPEVVKTLNQVGVVLKDTNADSDVGLQCTAINLISVASGNPCTANTVCCQNNNVGGGVSAGCVPVIL